jgi:hypothetical protein
MTVERHEIALDILADLVVAADLAAQDAIAQDVEWVNRQLGRNPHALGESRADGTVRIWFSTRVAVAFRIDAATNTVLVYHVVGLR